MEGKCGFDCGSCPYFRELCIGCAIEMCLVDKCIRGASYRGITYPRDFCRLRPYCPIGGRDRPPPVSLLSLGGKRMTKMGFSEFIPEVDVADERSWSLDLGEEK